MLKIELNPNPEDLWKEAAFGIYIDPQQGHLVTTSADVRTYCTDPRCDGMARVMTSPASLAEEIRATLAPGVRAMIGNAGCELTFRHIFRRPPQNIESILCWAEAALAIVKDRLVLAPMDYDLVHDIKTGGRLLAWAAAQRIPLAVFCGYRFLFRGDEFSHLQQVNAKYPFYLYGNRYRYPFTEVSEAIRSSHAEVWTGAGFTGGLEAGALQRAEQFGFAGVMTTKDAWNAWQP